MTDMIVSYEGSLRCRAEHPESGTILLTDAPKDHHGQGESFSPSDLLSVALGSCILSVMGIAARSMNLELAGASATVSKEMHSAPRRIGRISVSIRVPGAFDHTQQVKLEAAAHACPVHQVLGIDAPITIEWVS